MRTAGRWFYSGTTSLLISKERREVVAYQDPLQVSDRRFGIGLPAEFTATKNFLRVVGAYLFDEIAPKYVWVEEDERRWSIILPRRGVYLLPGNEAYILRGRTSNNGNYVLEDYAPPDVAYLYLLVLLAEEGHLLSVDAKRTEETMRQTLLPYAKELAEAIEKFEEARFLADSDEDRFEIEEEEERFILNFLREKVKPVWLKSYNPFIHRSILLSVWRGLKYASYGIEVSESGGDE